jgi:hypothetical protein
VSRARRKVQLQVIRARETSCGPCNLNGHRRLEPDRAEFFTGDRRGLWIAAAFLDHRGEGTEQLVFVGRVERRDLGVAHLPAGV